MATMWQPAAPQCSGSSPTVSKKALSYKYTINDIPSIFKFGPLKTPPFSVPLTKDCTSLWHLRIERIRVAVNRSAHLTVSLYQGWDESHVAANQHGMLKVALNKCRLKLLRPVRDTDTEEVVLNETPLVTESLVSICNTDPVEVSIWREIYYSRHVEQGKLIVLVEAEILHTIVTSGDSIPPDSSRKDMYRLYLCGSLTDMTIKCEDKEFKVHKAVLASQSPVFRGMFEADMLEARSGVVEVSGVTSTAMSDLITYIYTGTAPHLRTLANELLDVSSRYQIDRLFKMCVKCV